MKKDFIKIIENIAISVLIMFGIFLLYQVIKNFFGGSWTTENIIFYLLIFNLGSIFTIGLIFVKLNFDHNHLTNQFISLANDFKKQIRK